MHLSEVDTNRVHYNELDSVGSVRIHLIFEFHQHFTLARLIITENNMLISD